MRKTSEIIWQDNQHQVLFKLIDKINAKVVDRRIFRQLCDYAEYHFKLEEEYMLKLDFPGTQQHIRAHDKFRSELQTMMREYTTYDELFRHALSEFLTEWLKSHVFGIDKKLEEYILDSPFK